MISMTTTMTQQAWFTLLLARLCCLMKSCISLAPERKRSTFHSHVILFCLCLDWKILTTAATIIIAFSASPHNRPATTSLQTLWGQIQWKSSHGMQAIELRLAQMDTAHHKDRLSADQHLPKLPVGGSLYTRR